MKPIVFLLLIGKLAKAIPVRVHFREERGVIVMVEKTEYIYSDVLKAETYNEAYDVFIFKHSICEAVHLETRQRINVEELVKTTLLGKKKSCYFFLALYIHQHTQW